MPTFVKGYGRKGSRVKGYARRGLSAKARVGNLLGRTVRAQEKALKRVPKSVMNLHPELRKDFFPKRVNQLRNRYKGIERAGWKIG